MGKRAWRVRRLGFAAVERGGPFVLVVGSDGRPGLLVRVEKRDVRKTFDGGIDVGCKGDIWGRKGAEDFLMGPGRLLFWLSFRSTPNTSRSPYLSINY